MTEKIRVLVVDDSILFRRTIVEGISKHPNIEVVAMAADPYEARDCIIKFKPDVMTLDVEMPKMNGIDFLKKLMPQYPMPVIMVSAVDNKVFEALKYGALDFVVKSNIASNNALESFIQELSEKILIASKATIKKQIIHTEPLPSKTDKMPLSESPNKPFNKSIDLITIGASTGGTDATEKIISKLPAGLPPILIVQHMPPVFTNMYAERLNKLSAVEVREAKTGDILQKGYAYIAPGGLHMKLQKSSEGYMLRCFEGEKTNGHMPSVDVLFHSVSEFFSTNVVSVLLTGMGNDGAQGLLKLHRNGAKTIGQDEKTSVVYGMPKIAYELGAVDVQLPLPEIASQIIQFCQRS